MVLSGGRVLVFTGFPGVSGDGDYVVVFGGLMFVVVVCLLCLRMCWLPARCSYRDGGVVFYLLDAVVVRGGCRHAGGACRLGLSAVFVVF